MNSFEEIVRILDRFREPRIETIDTGFRARKEDKDFQLYDGIRQGAIKNDASAASILYNSSSTDNRYTTLKNRLKRRLLNSLFHLNLKKAGFSESAQARYILKKKAFLADTLLRLGARTAAIRIAERTLALAQKYEQTDLVLEMSLMLRKHASIIGKTFLFELYDTIVKKTFRNFEAEILSSEFQDRAQSIRIRKAGGRHLYAPQLQTYVDELQSKLNEESTFTFRLNYYRLRAMTAGAAGETTLLLAACDEALAYLRSVPHLAQKGQHGEFLLFKLEGFIASQRFALAQKTLADAGAIFEYGSNNWFVFAESNFLLLMNTLDFVSANDFYREVTNHPRFRLQSEVTQEHWRIYELYLHYVLRRMDGYEKMEIRKRFNLNRFLGMSPAAAQDKHGFNIALLIGQVLYMHDEGNFHGINDRMEALTTYRVRWLRVTDNPRSNLFFKLLRMMENTSFSYEIALERGDRYYQELKVLRPEIVHIEEELQIVPYEWLWERVLEKLRDLKVEGKTPAKTPSPRSASTTRTTGNLKQAQNT